MIDLSHLTGEVMPRERTWRDYFDNAPRANRDSLVVHAVAQMFRSNEIEFEIAHSETLFLRVCVTELVKAVNDHVKHKLEILENSTQPIMLCNCQKGKFRS